MNVSVWKEKDNKFQLVNKVGKSLIWEKALREDIEKSQSNAEEQYSDPWTENTRQQYRLYVTEFIILSLGEKDYDVQSKYIQCF